MRADRHFRSPCAGRSVEHEWTFARLIGVERLFLFCWFFFFISRSQSRLVFEDGDSRLRLPLHQLGTRVSVAAVVRGPVWQLVKLGGQTLPRCYFPAPCNFILRHLLEHAGQEETQYPHDIGRRFL